MARQTLELPFIYRENSYLLVGDYYSEDPVDNRGIFTRQEVTFTLELTKEYWILYLILGFQSFGIGDNPKTYRVIFDQEKLGNADANDLLMNIGLDRLRNNEVTSFKFLLLHELFHAVNSSINDPFQPQKIFQESGANIAAFLCSAEIQREIGISSIQDYLNKPEATMWDRTSPGFDGDSFSSATLWWLYFCDQLGERTIMPGVKTDTLRDMIREDGWNSAFTETEYTKPETLSAIGKFLGNGDTQLIFDSILPNRRFSLISANQSMGGKGAMHIRATNNVRWQANGWKVRQHDRIVGVGDVIGNGQDQILMMSSTPMNLGILGYFKSSGAWHQTGFRTFTSGSENSRWGDWKLRNGDSIAAIDHFLLINKKHILIRSRSVRGGESAYMGLIGVNNEMKKESFGIVTVGSSFGTNGWILQEDDRVVGTGDIVGNGSAQIVIQRANGSALGIIGYLATGEKKTYLNISSGERFGGQWKLNPGDRILEIGKFQTADRSSMLIKSDRNIIGIVGLNTSGNSETGPVVSNGQTFGESGWQWNRGHEIEGSGKIAKITTDQFVVRNGNDLAIIGINNSGSFSTFDSTSNREKVKGLNRIMAIGDFAGRGNDSILGIRSSRDVNYLVNLNYEFHEFQADEKWVQDYADVGHWRDRFAINLNNDKFTSTHHYLSQFIIEKGDNRSLTDFWRDFTVTNKTKYLDNSPPELTYSISFINDNTLVKSNPYSSASSREIAVERWAATYLDISLNPIKSNLRLKAEVFDPYFGVYWTVVTVGSSNELKSVYKEEGNTFDKWIRYEAGDQITLIITTSWVNAIVTTHPLQYR